MKFVLLLAIGFASYSIFAGTIFFKDGTKISGVEIISISDGKVVIEKDKSKRSYAVGKIKSYYGTDIEGGGGEAVGSFSDYKVSIISVDMPKDGYKSKSKKKKKRTTTTKCEVEYSISRKGKSKRIKVPYFYLYVIVPGKDEVSGRSVYRYYYPKHAKPKGKDYDEAAIMKELLDFGRPVWNSDHHRVKGGLHGKKVSFNLSGIKNRKIIAWRLEVWGGDTMVAEKEEKIRGLNNKKVGKNWWKSHKFK